jgi:hypothetical protein
MKYAIETAIKNEFNLYGIKECTTWFLHDGQQGGKDNCLVIDNTYDLFDGKGRRGTKHHLQLRELTFGTDFIDKLVGEGKPDCGAYCGKCAKSMRLIQTLIDEGKLTCKGKHDGDWCKYLLSWQDADYHRREMANIKDIEKLKEYIRGLV